MVGTPATAPAGTSARPAVLVSATMTKLQAALLHGGMGVVAIAAATVLAILRHITGTDALAIILAAGGVTGTGLAGTFTGTTTTTTTPARPTSSAASPVT